MEGVLVVLSLVAAVVLGSLTALLAGPALGVAVGLALVVAGVVAQRAPAGPRRGIGLVLLGALLAGGSYGAVLAVDVVEALTTTDGTPEPADPDQLRAARDDLAAVGQATAFRLELSEAELQAVVQDGIAADPDLPVRRVDLDLRGDRQDVAFTATFKAGGVRADGTATVTAAAGGIDLTLGPLRFAGVRLPGVAQESVQQLLASVTDLNRALESQGAVVQAVQVRDDALVVIGTRRDGTLTGGQLLAAIREQASRGPEQVPAPPEVLGPGTVDAREAPGEPIVLALGDSLAAGEGVARLADGYVSRFHRAVSERDGVAYGLVNLAQSGETSATLLHGGQLAAAEEVLTRRRAAYVTIDIGANDLLGHLESPDCQDLRAAACQSRVEQTLTAYQANLETILPRLVAVGDGARVLLLQTYNPFSLGLGDSPQERESSAIVARLNAVAAQVAARHEVEVADGFTPMQGTTARTTRMLDAVPDVHPNALGHDVLAQALFALG